ncbi:MAG: cobalt transporter [Nitrospinae bacterium]|nr:cobalt transporter [Nitrospinota bacterium]
MNRILVAGAALAALWGGAVLFIPATWIGIDEGIVGKVAERAGRPAWEPFINTDQGDLLLFVFLAAGVAGGFVMGYYFRELFGAPDKTEREAKR